MYHSSAIVLYTYPVDENDVMVSFFTEKFGKIQIRVRGAQKPRTRQGRLLHSFSVLDISFLLGRHSPILTGIVERRAYPPFSSHIWAFGYVYSFLYTVHSVLYEYEKDIAVWQFLVSVFDTTHRIILRYTDTALIQDALWYGEKVWMESLLRILGADSPYQTLPRRRNTQVDVTLCRALERVSNTPIQCFGRYLYGKR